MNMSLRPLKKPQTFISNLNWRNLIAGKKYKLITDDNCESHGNKVMRKPELEII